MDGALVISSATYLKPFQFDILSCEIPLTDNADPFGSVVAASLAVRGLLRNGTVNKYGLFDEEGPEASVATAILDVKQRQADLTVWCLAEGNRKDYSISGQVDVR